MFRRMRKGLCLVLVCIMLLTLLPVAAVAAEEMAEVEEYSASADAPRQRATPMFIYIWLFQKTS